jgi:serine protease Do
MNIRSAVFLILVGFGVVTIYQLRKEQQSLHYRLNELSHLHGDAQKAPAANIDTSSTQVIEKIVEKTHFWRGVQDLARNTVVQIFAQVAELDLLQPYKTPAQYPASGSGFFINNQGDIITNAHVINQAKAIWIQIPELGKRIVEVDVISLSIDRDIALLRVKPQDLEYIKTVLGDVRSLSLGNSDLVRRADDVMALGYPLGQQALKSTTGIISGREGQFIQMSAAINPGNSGGPLLNLKGEVVGINTAIIAGAQNVGYIIPINDLKVILDDMYRMPLIRKPFLGVLFNNGTETLAEFLGNPEPGGCYVVEVIDNSTLAKVGVQRGDMIYTINGYQLDIYGEMSVPWSEDKISIIDYVSRLSIGQELMLTVYRNGERRDLKVAFSQAELPAVRRIYPGYESVDYEVFAGMVVMPLSLNHIQLLAQNAPGLTRFGEVCNQTKQTLVVTHIFPSSQLYRSRTITVGSTINEVNGKEVHTLADLREALQQGDGTFLSIRASDHVARASDHVFVTLSFDKVLEEERRLSYDYHYPLSETALALLKTYEQRKNLVAATTTVPVKTATM